MLISEAITLLQNAQLKQLGIKTDTSAIIGYINLAVLEIYKRFNLRQDEAVITMATDVTQYTLDGIDANVAIDFSDHQFLLIDEVYEETGELMSLNDEKDPYGVTTPRYNVIEVAEVVVGQQISVIYRSAPLFSTLVSDTILVPPQFFEALFNYVGFQAHSSVKGDMKSENNTHYLRFEESCNKISALGLVNHDDMVSYAFELRGFA